METEKLAQKLAGWIKSQVSAAGAKGVVFGMSGGLDSSVIAALCVRVFPKTSLGLIMPCYSNEEDQEHAELVTKKFSIHSRLVVLDSFADVFTNNMPDFKTGLPVNHLAQANLKARLRMVTLYYAANQLNYLVVGSGNRSELMTGYFTKYGDAGVDILPIGNLVKREVRELASYLEIPQIIIDKAPTAGLWPGQTDEGEMGFTYEALDDYILSGKTHPELKKSIDAMNARSAHKRATPPIPEL
jgi:NAD+ synthase